jgi:hypothetical protein
MKNTENTQTVPIKQLVGKDISGKRAIVTQPEHWDWFKHESRRLKERELIRAEYKIKKGKRWLYIFWKPEGSCDYDCGYSGWSETYSWTIPTVTFVEAAQ